MIASRPSRPSSTWRSTNQWAAFRSRGITAPTLPHATGESSSRRGGQGDMLPPRSATVSLIPLLFPTLIAGASQSGGIDSLSVLRSARRAQDAFEITRRENLPLRPSGSNDGRYEVIGRIRYWYEHGGDEDNAPPAPPQIRRARTPLAAALRVPGPNPPLHGWVLRQSGR